jgi:short-subunit dehydrogenase
MTEDVLTDARPGGRPHDRPLAVVTGASSGIGRELARQFAEHGFDLLITAEDAELADAKRDLEGTGVRVDAVTADLRTYDGCEAAWAAIRASGPVDAVAFNAGIGAGGPFTEVELQAHLDVVALNVSSQVHLARRVVPDMVARGQGRVLFTSSIAATQPGPFQSVYSASKAFLYSLAEAMREELKDTGVTVTALLPGPTDTEFFERADMTDTKVATGSKDDPADVARDGFEALMSGKGHVVAGSVKNKVQAASAKVLPERAKTAAHRRMSEPGTGDGGDGG